MASGPPVASQQGLYQGQTAETGSQTGLWSLGTGAHRNGWVAKVVEAGLPHRLTCKRSHFTLTGHTDSTCLKLTWMNESPRRTNLAAAAGFGCERTGQDMRAGHHDTHAQLTLISAFYAGLPGTKQNQGNASLFPTTKLTDDIKSPQASQR